MYLHGLKKHYQEPEEEVDTTQKRGLNEEGDEVISIVGSFQQEQENLEHKRTH